MEKKVTIGIPVYNEEKDIEQTLESVVNNLAYIAKVIISDNNSTDKTSEICKKYAEKYAEIIYIKQKGIPSLENLYTVIEMADTEYYIHIGGHDILPQKYVKILLEAIEGKKDVVNAFTDIVDRKTKKSGAQYCIKRSNDLQSEDWFVRFIAYLETTKANALFYGINRTLVLQKACRKYRGRYNGIGIDNLINLRMLCDGKSIYVDSQPVLIRWNFQLERKQAHDRYRSRNIKISEVNPYDSMQNEVVKILLNRGVEKQNYKIKTVKGIMYERFQASRNYVDATWKCVKAYLT